RVSAAARRHAAVGGARVRVRARFNARPRRWPRAHAAGGELAARCELRAAPTRVLGGLSRASLARSPRRTRGIPPRSLGHCARCWLLVHVVRGARNSCAPQRDLSCAWRSATRRLRSATSVRAPLPPFARAPGGSAPDPLHHSTPSSVPAPTQERLHE